MPLRILFILLSLLLCFCLRAQQPDAILGSWLNAEKDGRIQLFKTGNTYSGKITWLKEPYEADGVTPKKDSKNSNASLRSRTILNLVILSGFSYDDGEWTGGEIYDPKSGKTYSCKMKMKNQKLEIRGYIGISLFGRTTTWTRG